MTGVLPPEILELTSRIGIPQDNWIELAKDDPHSHENPSTGFSNLYKLCRRLCGDIDVERDLRRKSLVENRFEIIVVCESEDARSGEKQIAFHVRDKISGVQTRMPFEFRGDFETVMDMIKASVDGEPVTGENMGNAINKAKKRRGEKELSATCEKNIVRDARRALESANDLFGATFSKPKGLIFHAHGKGYMLNGEALYQDGEEVKS